MEQFGEGLGGAIAAVLTTMLRKYEEAMQVGGQWRWSGVTPRGTRLPVWTVKEIHIIQDSGVPSREDRFRLEAEGQEARVLTRQALVDTYMPVTSRAAVTVQEAGRRGGSRTRDTQPVDHFQKIGARGGKKVAERGPAYFRELGQKGGEALRLARGPEHFRQLGKKGGAKAAERGREYFQELARKSHQSRKR
jgi:general stress protein YciG